MHTSFPTIMLYPADIMQSDFITLRPYIEEHKVWNSLWSFFSALLLSYSLLFPLPPYFLKGCGLTIGNVLSLLGGSCCPHWMVRIVIIEWVGLSLLCGSCCRLWVVRFAIIGRVVLSSSGGSYCHYWVGCFVVFGWRGVKLEIIQWADKFLPELNKFTHALVFPHFRDRSFIYYR